MVDGELCVVLPTTGDSLIVILYLPEGMYVILLLEGLQVSLAFQFTHKRLISINDEGKVLYHQGKGE